MTEKLLLSGGAIQLAGTVKGRKSSRHATSDREHIEAQAAGLPVVATRSGGPEEIITDRDSGLLVPTNNPQALADALREALDDPGLAEKLAAAGRQSAQRRFSIETMLDSYEDIYRSLQRGKR